MFWLWKKKSIFKKKYDPVDHIIDGVIASFENERDNWRIRDNWILYYTNGCGGYASTSSANIRIYLGSTNYATLDFSHNGCKE